MGLSTNAYLVIGLIGVIMLALLLRSALRKPVSMKVSTASRSGSSASKKPAIPQNPYRAISIVAGPKACDAVISLQHKRYLMASKEVPPLPLPDCDQTKCTCKYAHHADRREEGGSDRRGPPGLRSELHSETGGDERRTKRRGRRASDWE
jgi:hypothetical protein